MPEIVHDIVYKFAQKIKVIYGDALKQVIVYGSYARGDYQKNSDVDIMILVDASDAQIKKKFNSVCDVAFDFELEYGIVISPLVKNEEHFMKWSETLPFYQNVRGGRGDNKLKFDENAIELSKHRLEMAENTYRKVGAVHV